MPAQGGSPPERQQQEIGILDRRRYADSTLVLKLVPKLVATWQVELHPLLAQRKLVGVCLRKVRMRGGPPP